MATEHRVMHVVISRFSQGVQYARGSVGYVGRLPDSTEDRKPR